MDRVRELSPATGYFSPPPRHAPPAHRSQLGPSRRRQPKMPSSGPEKRLSWSLPDQHIAAPEQEAAPLTKAMRRLSREMTWFPRLASSASLLTVDDNEDDDGPFTPDDGPEPTWPPAQPKAVNTQADTASGSTRPTSRASRRSRPIIGVPPESALLAQPTPAFVAVHHELRAPTPTHELSLPPSPKAPSVRRAGSTVGATVAVGAVLPLASVTGITIETRFAAQKRLATLPPPPVSCDYSMVPGSGAGAAASVSALPPPVSPTMSATTMPDMTPRVLFSFPRLESEGSDVPPSPVVDKHRSGRLWGWTTSTLGRIFGPAKKNPYPSAQNVFSPPAAASLPHLPTTPPSSPTEYTPNTPPPVRRRPVLRRAAATAQHIPQHIPQPQMDPLAGVHPVSIAVARSLPEKSARKHRSLDSPPPVPLIPEVRMERSRPARPGSRTSARSASIRSSHSVQDAVRPPTTLAPLPPRSRPPPAFGAKRPPLPHSTSMPIMRAATPEAVVAAREMAARVQGNAKLRK